MLPTAISIAVELCTKLALQNLAIPRSLSDEESAFNVPIPLPQTSRNPQTTAKHSNRPDCLA